MVVYLLGLAVSLMADVSMYDQNIGASFAYIVGTGFLVGSLLSYLCVSPSPISPAVTPFDELVWTVSPYIFLAPYTIYFCLAFVTPWWVIALAPLPVEALKYASIAYANHGSSPKMASLVAFCLGLGLCVGAAVEFFQ